MNQRRFPGLRYAYVAHSIRLLIVEPDPAFGASLEAAAQRFAAITVCHSFQSARTQLHSDAYDFLVTNLRLSEHNGLHLVYLGVEHPPGHAVVYDDPANPGVVSEVQRAGAFYEVAHRLPITLPAYITAKLPAADRRARAVFDRRQSARGGRRRWDRHAHVAQESPSPSFR